MPAGTNYTCWITDDTGARLAPAAEFLQLEATRTVGRIGWFDAKLPASAGIGWLDPTAMDRMFQIWRTPAGGRLYLWGLFFIRSWVFTTEAGTDYIYISGPCINDVLRRRIVAYYAGNAGATATAEEADDLMKRIVTGALTDGSAPAPAYGTRVWSRLSVDPDWTLGPAITRAFAWEKLLTPTGAGILPAIASAAKEQGTEVFYDVVPHSVTPTGFLVKFRTWVGQPGADLTGRVMFDDAANTLVDAQVGYDASEEETYFYGGGQGEEELRNIQQVYDATRIGYSVWGRSEGFTDARDQDTDNGVIARARGDLRAGRPRYWFQGTPVDSPIARYGVNWELGDQVRAKYKEWFFDTIIRTVTIRVQGEEEQIRTRLEWEAGE